MIAIELVADRMATGAIWWLLLLQSRRRIEGVRAEWIGTEAEERTYVLFKNASVQIDAIAGFVYKLYRYDWMVHPWLTDPQTPGQTDRQTASVGALALAIR